MKNNLNDLKEVFFSRAIYPETDIIDLGLFLCSVQRDLSKDDIIKVLTWYVFIKFHPEAELTDHFSKKLRALTSEKRWWDIEGLIGIEWLWAPKYIGRTMQLIELLFSDFCSYLEDDQSSYWIEKAKRIDITDYQSLSKLIIERYEYEEYLDDLSDELKRRGN